MQHSPAVMKYDHTWAPHARLMWFTPSWIQFTLLTLQCSYSYDIQFDTCICNAGHFNLKFAVKGPAGKLIYDENCISSTIGPRSSPSLIIPSFLNPNATHTFRSLSPRTLSISVRRPRYQPSISVSVPFQDKPSGALFHAQDFIITSRDLLLRVSHVLCLTLV